MPTFDAIPKFTRHATYSVNVGWKFLPTWVKEHQDDFNLDLDPDFQRGHVWTPEQQVRYVEFILRGGASGRDIQTNCVNWNSVVKPQGPYVLVDGKQRLTAALAFLNNEFAVFEGQPYGGYYEDFTGRLSITGVSFTWHVNDLDTRAEVLQWYLDLNAGGVVHTDEELTRVRKLLEQEK